MAKTDFLTADMTRRQFMKISGRSLAGLTLSASMLSLFGCSQQQVDSGAVATWALPQGLLVVNADLCTGCQRCEINCTLTNDGVCSSYISRVKIQRRLNLDGAGNGLLSGTDNCFVYFPDTCRQCEDPACGNACPQKAITTDDRGIRVVDTDKCIGCGSCQTVCPYDARHLAASEDGYFGSELSEYEAVMYETMPPMTMDKCTFCAERIDAGKGEVLSLIHI